MGQNYIWTLVRGYEGAGQFTEDVFSNVWATDGSCRACTFPMLNSAVKEEAPGQYSIECGSCGSKWALDDGAVLEWLPGNGPVQWMAKKVRAAPACAVAENAPALQMFPCY